MSSNIVLKIALLLSIAISILSVVEKNQDLGVTSDLHVEVDSAIVSNRMVTVHIIITGEKGQFDKLNITQNNSFFYFGTAITPFELLGRDGNGENYREFLKEYFNKVTIEDCLKPHIWDSTKLKKSTKYHIDSVFSALEWLKINNIPIRGHNLINNNIKLFIGRNDVQRADEKRPYVWNIITSSVTDRINQTKDYVTEWDVINHAVIKDKEPTSVKNYLGMQYYKALIDTVKSLSNTKIYLNETNILFGSDRLAIDYYERIEELVKMGCQIDGIGIMGHFHDKNRFDLDKVKQRLDLFAQLNIPILITEFDYRFGNQGEVMELSEKDEMRQAQRTGELLKLFFSHSAVEGVILWGFWEGRHWYPSAALFNEDWSIKPNGKVYEELVLNKWRSNYNFKVVSGDTINVKLFKGVYDFSFLDKKDNQNNEIMVNCDDQIIQLKIPLR